MTASRRFDGAAGPSTGSENPETAATADAPVLDARAITKHFTLRGLRERRVVHAVDEIDLQLGRGRIVALVGESGSGKSTVAKLLAHLIPATSGELMVDGVKNDARYGRKFREYCARVQMIFQDPFASLNPIHTVRYLLGRSLRLHHPKLRGKAFEAALIALLERVHLTPAERYIDKYPHELSGGQRQRVAIARALGADPVVLLADEPVSMLDVSIRLGILNLLAELRDRMHLAILYITHDIASARYFADETYVMYAGQIVEKGDSESVTQDPAHPYTRLLISSAPDPDQLMTGTAVDVGSGEPPSLVSPPSGCRFHTRCEFAAELCSSSTPPLIELEDGRRAACWLYGPDVPGAPVGRGGFPTMRPAREVHVA